MNRLKISCEDKVNDLLKYMAINKLSANDDKTKILVMRHGKNKDQLTFNIGDFQLKETQEEKLLGIWVSNELNWSKHTEELEDELRFRLYKLRRIEQCIPKSLLKRVADGIFNSLLRYGLGIFCPIRTQETDPVPSCISGIRTIFNDVLRLLCNSRREQHDSIKSMLDKVGWLSINQLACQVRLVETWKALHLENYCLNEVFERVENGSINTRSSNKIKLKSHFNPELERLASNFPVYNCGIQHPKRSLRPILNQRQEQR